ncbi:MAG: exo-beta-N-acetylmuramidase NamZ domain-containing protein [Desulfobacterales bacterium]
MAKVSTGLENLIRYPHSGLENKHLGLLCNQASVDGNFRHARDLIANRFPGQLKVLFSPQHGFFAEKQDNMIESGDFTESRLSIPVYSLYGKTRSPTPSMMDKIDVLLVDLQDAGTRVYTFFSTLSLCMEAAAETDTQVVVLDRPNPVGGMQVEGNCLDPRYSSFVGRYPIPMRHGLTIGEFAGYINRVFNVGCRLEVIPMKGWDRSMYFEDTGLAWVAPSPNLPAVCSVVVYPGQVIWEGTNVSEGRGTTLPFELFGAPFINTVTMEKALGGITGFEGAVLRPAVFEPTSGKWAQTPCRGFQIHVTDRRRFRPYLCSLKLLSAVINLFPKDFAWNPPPYEYEYEKLPFDIITGDPEIRKHLEAGLDPSELEDRWLPGIRRYLEQVRPFYIYK